MASTNVQNQISKVAFAVALGILLTLNTGCEKKEKHVDSMNEQVQITSEEMRPDDFFSQSLQAFANKDYKKSSKLIEKSIQSMKVIADFVPANQQQEIINSIKELQELASKVAVDKVEGIDELNYFFARAGKSLAGLHMHTAESYYFDLHGKQAGNELREALGIIEKTVRYHGRALSDDERQLLASGRELANQLEKGNTTKEELENYLTTLSNQITKLDNELDIQFESIASKRKTEIHTK